MKGWNPIFIHGLALLSLAVMLTASACRARQPAGRPAEPLPPELVQQGDSLPHVNTAAIARSFPILPQGYRNVVGRNIQSARVVRLTDMSMSQCVYACTEASGFYCVSLDYFEAERICDLSNQTGVSAPVEGPQPAHFEKRLSDAPR